VDLVVVVVDLFRYWPILSMEMDSSVYRVEVDLMEEVVEELVEDSVSITFATL
jgi:hypothetical protein